MTAPLENDLERAVLEAVAPRLEAEGYRVLIQPPSSALPPFLKGKRPDAIAIKPGHNIAIEVMSDRADRAKLKQLQGIFAAQPEWELRVFYAPPREGTSRSLHVAPREAITQALDSIPALSDSAGRVPALLVAWAAFEAAGRALVPDRLGDPQRPSQLVEVLAAEGHITPKEADLLRALIPLRNRAAHGELDVRVTSAQLGKLVAIVNGLLAPAPKPKPEPRRARRIG
jgi:hypothetical protein